MGSSPSVPSVPDPFRVANQQQQINLQALEGTQTAQQPNQSNFFGNTTWTPALDANGKAIIGPGGVPQYTATQTLSPQMQQLFNQYSTGKTTADTAGSNLLSSAAGMYSQAPNLSAQAGGLTQDLLSKETSYLNPYFKAQTESLDSQLRNQGLKPGDPGYDRAMMAQQGNQNQAVTGFLASAEPQAFQQAYQEWAAPATMAGNLLGIGQPFGTPGSGNVAVPSQSMQPANLIGAVSAADQANMQAYQAQLAQSQAMMNGIFGIGSALAGGLGRGGLGMGLFSDRRVKRDIQQVGSLFDGTPVYRFRYVGSPTTQIGLMAQDVEQYAPEAVGELHGIKWVDYHQATERAARSQ